MDNMFDLIPILWRLKHMCGDFIKKVSPATCVH